jgi:hypothetical protein
MHRIVSAVPSQNLLVQLTWADGTRTVADFTPWVRRGGVFAPLADPDFFGTGATVADDGHVLAWSDDLEFSADGLWYDAFPADRDRDIADAESIDPVISARTGQRCPASGIWIVPDHPERGVPIVVGEIMPSFAGRAVEWMRMAG